MTLAADGSPQPITGDFANLVELFDAVVATAGDREAFVDAGRRMTFRAWADAGDRVAGWLHEHGVVKGDVVGIRLASSIEYAVAYQGVIRAGAIASGMNPRLGPSETDYILAKTSCAVVFDSVDVVQDAMRHEPLRTRPSLALDDPVAIVWTSGTTGFPKGAVFDHACLRAMAAGAGVLSRVGDRRLSPLPFAHVGYMTRVWDELMHLITTIIVPSPWTAQSALRLIAEERVTVGQGVPAQWALMLGHQDFSTTDVSSLRVAGTGASRVPPELVHDMRAKLGCDVTVRYTSTEACLSTGTVPGDPDDVIANTVGKPAAGVELRLIDDMGHDVPPGDVGIVTLRSRAMMRGYWHDAERTAEAITPDGWLITGDQGFVGSDGNLRLVGRRTEMYIRGGYNVYPTEVENCLGAHPAVVRVAVLGAGPVPIQGEIGVAFVVPRPGVDLSVEDVRSFVKARLAGYKAPDVLVLVADIPLTSMSKPDKQALRPQADAEAARWRR